MQLFVPFAAERPKTRLSELLTPEERQAFSRAMLADVLDALASARGDVHPTDQRAAERVGVLSQLVGVPPTDVAESDDAESDR